MIIRTCKKFLFWYTTLLHIQSQLQAMDDENLLQVTTWCRIVVYLNCYAHYVSGHDPR